MSQNNTSTIYAGLDIHKATLQLHFAGKDCELPNTPAGHRKLVLLVQKEPGAHVICEASGGYERKVVAYLQGDQIPVSVLNPVQSHEFAKVLGRRAKTDPLDARLLSQCGYAIKPAPTPAVSAQQRHLMELVRYRQQLLEKLIAERQQAELIEQPLLRRQSLALAKRMEADVAKLDALLASLCKESQELSAKLERLTCVKGVGDQTAYSLLAEMPELGTLSRRKAASLAGLAPFARERGKWVGKRFIGGGRPQVRKALYMAALCASRLNPTLSAFYKRLRDKGKPAKVALTAVMRKLLVLLNFILKNTQLSLAS